MKTKKLFAILVLSVFLFTATAPGAFAGPNVNINLNAKGPVQISINFGDMDQAQWAQKQVMKMRFKNVILGYKDGNFRPNKPVTRAEAVVMTMRAAGLQDEVDNTVVDSVYLPYKDAKNIPFWAAKAITAAVKRGYLSPVRTEEFQPNKPATREWVVRLVVKALNLEPMSSLELPFSDSHRISEDTRGYVAAVVYQQLLSGYPDGSFKPDKPVTRAEMAVILGISIKEVPIPGKISDKIEGKVVAAEVYSTAYAQGTITIDVKGDDRDDDGEEAIGVITLPVANKAIIYIDDKSGTLSQIAAGAIVEAIVDKNGMVVYIEVEPVTVKGVVEAVYNDEISIAGLTKGKRPWDKPEIFTYKAADNVVVKVNGVNTNLAELLPGDRVTLTLDAEGKVSYIKGTRFFRGDINKDRGDKEDDDKEESD